MKSADNSAKNIVPFPSREAARRNREEVAFLPAALEIVESPPSPVGRAIAFSLIVLFCLSIIWACVGKIDIVASATGKIVPSGRTKVIQPFETGVVRAIHVVDGQTVKAGDPLIELDPTMNAAEGAHLKSDLLASQLEVARLRAALADDDNPLAHFEPPPEASALQIATQRQFLINQVAEQRSKIAAIDRQRAQKEAERATSAATVDKLQASLPVLQQRVDIRKTLFDHETGSKANYLELLQSLVEAQKEIDVQKSHGHEAEAAVAALIETRAQTVGEYHRTLYTQLVEAERKAQGSTDDLVKADKRTNLQYLTAPVDGTVQQLAIHTVGAVVTPAQTLLVEVPTDSRLEIEANISNRDIGFIHAGQDVEIKVDTFNFTRYGLLHGKVLSISQDAIVRDKPQDRSGQGQKPPGSEDSSSEPSGQELNYSARISLDQTQMQVDDRVVNLSPGMAVTTEVKTGSRTIITYLLSPLLKFHQESLRER
jgi:hemolysin D